MQNTKFSGQPIFCQLLSLIRPEIMQQSVDKFESDKYYKKMTTYKQLVFMLYGVINKQHSLTSLCKCSIFLQNKLSYVQINELPAKSTLSDANMNRDSEVFEDLYYSLLDYYKEDLGLVLMHDKINEEADTKNLKRFDSTTITLFSQIFKGAGRLSKKGDKKGGVKMQTLMGFDSLVPEHIVMGDAAKNDKDYLGQLEVKKGFCYVFDKGYVNYSIFKRWTDEGIFFVTRLDDNASYEIMNQKLGENFDVVTGQGVLSDNIIKLKLKDSKEGLKLRLITYKDPESGKVLKFLSNQMDYQAITIALIYRNRWKIEVFFKQLKQNFQLDYFYSDSRKGIETQIWTVLIANMIFSIFHKRSKESEQFSTIVSMARQGLCSYICFTTIIKEKKLTKNDRNLEIMQQSLFDLEGGGGFEKPKKTG